MHVQDLYYGDCSVTVQRIPYLYYYLLTECMSLHQVSSSVINVVTSLTASVHVLYMYIINIVN